MQKVHPKRPVLMGRGVNMLLQIYKTRYFESTSGRVNLLVNVQTVVMAYRSMIAPHMGLVSRIHMPYSIQYLEFPKGVTTDCFDVIKPTKVDGTRALLTSRCLASRQMHL